MWTEFVIILITVSIVDSSETSNGINQQETGEIVDRGSEHEGISVRGSFTYTDPVTNTQYTVTYVADKNGNFIYAIIIFRNWHFCHILYQTSYGVLLYYFYFFSFHFVSSVIPGFQPQGSHLPVAP